MRRKLNYVPSVLCLFLLACGVVSATPYSWNGGDGSWADSGKWTPNGVPGALDSASFLVNSTQTVTVDADATPFSMSLDTGTYGAGQTFSIAPGINLTLDAFVLSASQPTAVTITGGGHIAITNEPLWVSGKANPMSFTVSGKGTFFDMPKPKQSGLYIGSRDLDQIDANNLFHVTAGATAIVANATCVGNAIGVGDGSRGSLLVDDGAYFDGGLFVYIGRNYWKPGVVCAVTNATLAGALIGQGAGWHHAFVGSNAVVRATTGISFAIDELVNSTAVRYTRMEFEDSLLEAPAITLIQGNSYSTGKLSRCVLKCDYLKGCLGQYAHDSLFDLVDSCVTSKEVRISAFGASNNLIRAIRSDINSTRISLGYTNSLSNTFRVEGGNVFCGVLNAGRESTGSESRYEQEGGVFTATNSVVAGSYASFHCGASFKNVSFSSPLIICGDILPGVGMRPENAYLEFADMAKMETDKLMVGLASVGADMLVTNTTASVTYRNPADDTYATIIGRDNDATRNKLTLVDSTLSQTGGHVYVGRYNGATNNTFRLVRSTYNFTTKDNKGDVIVGYAEGANGNRMELDDHSTFIYDRAWFAVGHNAASNVLAISNGSSLDMPSSKSQLRIGYGGSITDARNRLVLENGSSVRANKLYLDKKAVVEIAGAGNTMTFNEDITLVDGCSYVFRPNADVSATPMLTINRAFQYSVNRKIYVDVANAGHGRHVLLTSSSALTEPVAGSSVIFQNVPKNCSVRVSLSADTKSLVCMVAPTGTTIIFR